MLDYSSQPVSTASVNGRVLNSFTKTFVNADDATLRSFAEEWKRFGMLSLQEQDGLSREYFDVIPEGFFPLKGQALDIGCGSGRWSAYLSGKCESVEAIDAGDAVIPAAKNLESFPNVRVTQAGFGNIPFAENTFDFILSLGVIHHIPDTASAMKEINRLLKPGGRALLYVYYDISNRGFLYRGLFHISERIRRLISGLPLRIKFALANVLFFLVSAPLVLHAQFWKTIFPRAKWWKKLPLAYYVDKSWRIIRSDTEDRFCTPLAKRFSKPEIEAMMKQAGFKSVLFSDNAPYWHFTAVK